jgi:flagellar basal-body rod modification protein FlgD
MINSITSTTSSTTAAADAMKKATGMNKDDFMQLFVTQLQNQDPLNPQDSSQFIAQLAQLTQVEQSYNTNTNLQSLLSAVNGASNISAVSYIGKEVLAKGGDINLTPNGKPLLGYELSLPANQVALQIQDASGSTVRSITLGKSAAGQFATTWDGLDDNGRQLPAGAYSFTANGINADGSKFGAQPLIDGKVDGLQFDGTTPVLSIGGVAVPLANILAVNGVV